LLNVIKVSQQSAAHLAVAAAHSRITAYENLPLFKKCFISSALRREKMSIECDKGKST